MFSFGWLMVIEKDTKIKKNIIYKKLVKGVSSRTIVDFSLEKVHILMKRNL